MIIGFSIVNTQRSMNAVLLLCQSPMMIIPPSPPTPTTTTTSSISANVVQLSPPKLRLRYDYTNLERTSALAQDIAAMQSLQNCTAVVPSQPGYFWYRNRYGLGSDLHVYSVAICNALQMNSNNNHQTLDHTHVQTLLPWIWYDQDHCDRDSTHSTSSSSSAMACYFPESEPHCPGSPSLPPATTLSRNWTRPLGKIRESCPDILQQYGGIPALRTATTEFLFTRLSHLVQTEGERQLNRVFVGNGENNTTKVPPNLITVHIRWGDKADEMELVPIEHYVNAVRDIVQQRRRRRRRAQTEHYDTNHSGNDKEVGVVEEAEEVHIYVATVDPDAVRQFQAAVPSDWHLYLDQSMVELLLPDRPTASYNEAAHQARAGRGRPGLLALGSLLVAMEANDFVLTTSSNWSRLMNEIRISIIDPRCRNCTTLIDLNPGEW